MFLYEDDTMNRLSDAIANWAGLTHRLAHNYEEKLKLALILNKVWDDRCRYMNERIEEYSSSLC